MLGFTGLGGLRWLAGVLFARHLCSEESLTPQEIAGCETRYLEVAGEQVAYEEHGSGDQTIIFLHGFGGRLQTWSKIYPAFTDQYRTITFDLWGFGASGRPTWVAPRDWTTQVFGVMDVLGIPSAIFVAHSLGGRVSLMCAEKDPQRISSLALLDADWGHITQGYLLAWAVAHSPCFKLAMRRLRSNPEQIRRLMHMAYGPCFTIDDALVDLYLAPLRVQGTFATFSHLGRSALDSKINQIPATLRCRTLVIWGEQDYIIPVEWGRVLAGRIPGAEFHGLPTIGHFPQEEAPEEVIAYLRHFLDRTV